MSLGAHNVNHLVALDALLEERHVGRAAARMGVTQSAMSHTLRSLREMLGDPLLVRMGNDMVLTPHAESLRTRLRRGLQDLDAVVSGRAAFDPATISDTFTVAVHDGPAAALAAPLYTALRTAAPGARLRIQPLLPDRLATELAEGAVDVAVAPGFMIPQGVPRTSTAGVRTRVVCHVDHPVIRTRVSLAQYCKIGHATLTVSGEGPSFIDHLLAEHGRTREVFARVHYVLSLAEILSNSDLIASVPTPIAQFLCDLWPLKHVPCPLPIPPLPLELCWHPRYQAEPSHAFFLGLVQRTLEALGQGGNPRFDHSAGPRRPRS